VVATQSRTSGSGKRRGLDWRSQQVITSSPAHVLTLDLGGAQCHPSVELNRAVPPQQLLDGPLHRGGSSTTRVGVPSVGMAQQGPQTVADEVRGGLEAGREEAG